ncbi:MAG: putative glycoside hydrolase [Mycobacteriales bacterium]
MSRLIRPAVLVPAVLAIVLVAGTAAFALPGAGSAALTGLASSSLDAATLKDAKVSLPTDGHPAKVLLDGRQLAAGSSGTLTVSLAGLGDGVHTLVGELDRGFLRGTSTTQRRLVVDTTPPALTVTVPTTAVKAKDAVTVAGTVDEGATVSAAGGQVSQHGTAFTVHYPTPPAGAVVVATDGAGNRTERTVTVRTLYPSNIRAVHMTGRAWAYSKLRLPVIALVKQHRINAVELDIKDEDGIVNFPSRVPMAARVGARAAFYDAAKTTASLHRMGVRVIGRIVAFNDPKLADWAMAHGHHDWVIQNPDGSKYLYGYNKHGFSNFAAKPVRQYNEDLAVEAVKAGFDDVVYDYVRRPDGPIAKMRFPGLKGNPEDAIAGFLAEAQAQIRPLGGSLGAAAFAQAATRPKSTAQNIHKMAQHLDVVIPMDYPSHWNPGEYGVPDPYVGAYQIVQRSLVDWRKQVKGTGCVVVPWLQDENFRGRYDAAKVQQQIAGARANGIPGWLMWSAKAVYTGAAYSPDATPAR